MWKMFHDNNAIEAMAIRVGFAEPVSSLVVNRMIREVEKESSKYGLIDRQPVQAVRLELSPTATVTTGPASGVILKRHSLIKNSEGAVEQLLTLQVEVTNTHVTYHTWRYDRWKSEKQQALALLLGALRAATQAVTLAQVRVEYLDRFIFFGEHGDSNPSLLLNPATRWLAPHIFEAGNLWHSHTGQFVNVTAGDRILEMLNADALDLTGPPQFAGKRSISLMSAIEKQYVAAGDVDHSNVEDFLPALLDDLHDSAIRLFRDVIVPDFAKDNGLPHV